MLFSTVGLMWGLPYLFIKISVAELSPAAIVFARCAIGVVLLLPLAIYRRQIGPVLQHWKPLAAFAIIEICVPWLMLGYAEQKLSSSLTGLLIAAVPIVGAAVAALSGAEQLGPARIGGLVAGLVGVAALVGLDVGAAGALPVLAVSLAVVGYTVGPIILSKYLANQPGTAVIALSLAFAVVVYAPFVALDPPHLPVSSSVVLALLGLGVICTAASFIAFYALVGEVGPARAVVVAYVNPAVAIALGVGLLDEPFTAGTAIGFALIIGGSVLATRPSAPAGLATNPQPAPLVDSPIP
ncbi:MAG: EamA family transporter [Nocardiaceae bacterium]|nr:EamA family transporter [Nocardiaceae bacterium]